MSVPGARGGQERAMSPLELELQPVMSCPSGSEPQTWVLYRSSKCFLLLRRLSSSQKQTELSTAHIIIYSCQQRSYVYRTIMSSNTDGEKEGDYVINVIKRIHIFKKSIFWGKEQ